MKRITFFLFYTIILSFINLSQLICETPYKPNPINFKVSDNHSDVITALDSNVAVDKDTSVPAKKQPAKRDTFSFRYRFQKGDTLIYNIFSHDSISINYSEPLMRLRQEKIMITCDSVTPQGDFCLTQRLIYFKSKESYLEEKNITRNTTAWFNVPVYLEIDSLGRRKKVYNPDTLRAAIAPGGAFQPFLFLPLANDDCDTNTKLTKESWMVSGLTDIPENGMPVPLLRYNLLYRMIGYMDTLDFKSLLKMDFIVTSQGSIAVISDDVKVKTSSVNNAGGSIFWDTANWVPKMYVHTVEQKLTIYYSADKTEPGMHFIHSTYILDKFIRRQ